MMWPVQRGAISSRAQIGTRMQFIEFSGKSLFRLVNSNEVPHAKLKELGVKDKSLVRVNLQGDLEVRRADRWEVIGGLLGDFADRVKRETGLDWA
jgi:hypothetical protein